MKTSKVSTLSQKEKIVAFDYLSTFEREIRQEYGNFNWEYEKLLDFCEAHDIKSKEKRNCKKVNFFWFDTKKSKGINDTAHHFVRHLRNAIAHGHKTKTNKTIIVDDYEKPNKIKLLFSKHKNIALHFVCVTSGGEEVVGWCRRRHRQ